METSVGVFASRASAEEAVKELLDQHVPQDSIVFLTRSQADATAMGAAVGGTVAGATGLSLGVAAATALAVPGIGTVFALGFGAAALLGLLGTGTGAAIGKTMHASGNSPQPLTDKNSQDVAFFHEVLNQNRSLVIVRTESRDLASVASGILDRLGISAKSHSTAKLQASHRQVAEVVIIDLSGRITAGEGNLILGQLVRELVGKGNRKIILNMEHVEHVDSSGLGELISCHTTVRNHGGQLKLADLHRRVDELLKMTKLHTIFEIADDEATALKAIQAAA